MKKIDEEDSDEMGSENFKAYGNKTTPVRFKSSSSIFVLIVFYLF